MPPRKKPCPTDPDELGPQGRAVWDEVLGLEPDMPEYRRIILLEACWLRDRLHAIHAALAFADHAEPETVKTIVAAKSISDMMNRLIATLRLPGSKIDTRGGKPGVARGPKAGKKRSAAEIRAQMRSVS